MLLYFAEASGPFASFGLVNAINFQLIELSFKSFINKSVKWLLLTERASTIRLLDAFHTQFTEMMTTATGGEVRLL